MDLALLYIFQYVPNNPVRLELSTVQKKELFSFMKSTRDKEEYRRRASAIKQKMKKEYLQNNSQKPWCKLP